MRIAIVHGSDAIASVLERAVSSVRGWSVAWRARDGAAAVERAAADPPDILLLEAAVDAPETTRRLAAGRGCGIVLLTDKSRPRAGVVFEALAAGALDSVAIPSIGPDGRLEGDEEVLNRIRIVGRLRTPRAGQEEESARRARRFAAEARRDLPPLVALGASTGGPAALSKVLAAFPSSFPAAVVVVQHVGEEFSGDLVQWLSRQVAVPVRAAAPGGRPEAGTVQVAGGSEDLVLTPDLALVYRAPAPNSFYHPSVDAFFRSLAAHWPSAGIAVLLTGIGRDGAQGLLALRKAGWHTIAQDEATSVVYGMPKAAAELEAAIRVLPVDQIGAAIAGLVG